ncbi:UNVERIFIED_CONTAM: phage gp6-like head-tail connector protein, partial [Bifidobacterium breve]|nr:phage gp6-like head-tail connector protein [Bifidobacterium breve]
MAAITLAEAKAYLRVDNTVEDDLITKLIGSATATVENVLRQPLS